MKNLGLALLSVLFFLSCEAPDTNKVDSNSKTVETPAKEFYQLKVYTFSNKEQVGITDDFLKQIYLPALKAQGIKNIGVFKSIPNEKDSTDKTYVLIPYNSWNQVLETEDKMNTLSDEVLQNSAYHTASHEAPPYDRIETTLMRAFDDMPIMATPEINSPRAQRIYELRSYESSNENYYKRKVDMFNAGGEVKLFDRLGFNAVFYADVISGAKMPNLVYMTTFQDRPTRDSLWKEFVAAPEWKAIVDLPKYVHTVSHADVLLLYPTEYSDY